MNALRDKRFQYVLCTSIRTNGLDLHCLVYNLNRPAKKEKQASGKSIIEQAKSLRKRNKFERSETPILSPEQLKNLKIIGIDFGEVYAAGAVCKDMESYTAQEEHADKETKLNYNPNGILRNLKIKTAALAEPSRNYRNWLNHEKTERNFILEQQLLRNVGESVVDWFARWWPAYRELSSTFYNTKKVKKRKFDLKRALKREMDLAVNGILQMAGVNMKKKANPAKPLIFSIGDSQIGELGKIGYYSRFQRYFIKIVRQLGYSVMFNSEYYTSQKFPIAGYQTSFSGENRIRIKYCKELNIHINRDLMAGENMCDIAASQLLGLERPIYLKKTVSQAVKK